MKVFETVRPGMQVDWPDAKVGYEILVMIDLMTTMLADAAVTLDMFEQEQKASLASILDVPTREAREAESRRAREIENRLLPNPDDATWEERNSAIEQARAELSREKWKTNPPSSYVHRRSFILASSFVFALDSFEKALRVLVKKVQGIPKHVEMVHADLKKDLPDVTGVRDSKAHAEDRHRGLDKQGKRVGVDFGAGPSRILILDTLTDNSFSTMMADGRMGTVTITEATVERVQGALQQVIDSFSWKGPGHRLPLG
jgi:hypothetical protein